MGNQVLLSLARFHVLARPKTEGHVLGLSCLSHLWMTWGLSLDVKLQSLTTMTGFSF